MKKDREEYVILSKSKRIKTPLVPKCGCSTLLLTALKDNNIDYSEIKDYSNELPPHLWIKKNRILIAPEEYSQYKAIAVIRDPIKRLESAYNTIGNGMVYDDYISYLIKELSYSDNKYIDPHIRSQFSFYKEKDIDLFIELRDLDRYFGSIGIPVLHANISHSSFKIKDNKLLNLLDEDYQIYNAILNSDKLFR